MSAAATAAGYLYASGRLRGRGSHEREEKTQQATHAPKERIRVAVLEPTARPQRRAPKIEYRARKRWSPV